MSTDKTANQLIKGLVDSTPSHIRFQFADWICDLQIMYFVRLQLSCCCKLAVRFGYVEMWALQVFQTALAAYCCPSLIYI